MFIQGTASEGENDLALPSLITGLDFVPKLNRRV
jgi:hypothetical protein